MQAVYLSGGRLSLAERPAPSPAGEIPVDVTLAGICRTDLELVRGYMDFTGVPGHEFVGIARAGRLAGRRVVGEINCPCRSCPECAAGRHHHCPHRTVLGIAGRDGAFAETLLLPEANLIPLPDELPDRAAVFAEPLAAALRITEQVAPAPAAKAVVLGDGKLGLLCALVLARRPGPAVTLVGRHPEKMERISAPGLVRVVAGEERLRPDSCDLVVEATGRPGGLQAAIGLVRPLGTLVLKSTIAANPEIDLAPLVVKEVSLVGSRCGPLAQAVELLARGEIDPRGLVDQVFPLARAEQALDAAARPGALKVLLQVGRS